MCYISSTMKELIYYLGQEEKKTLRKYELHKMYSL